MADLFVCPVEGKSYPTVDDLLRHCEVAHQHRRDIDDCRCRSCYPDDWSEIE